MSAISGFPGDDLILVTGGAGFIGSNIVNDLAQSGARVVICDLFRSGEKWRNLAAAPLFDIVCPESLFDWLGRHRGELTAIIHMAAISSTTERDVDKFVATNVRLTLDLWDWCAATGTRLIYASSAATYGNGGAGFSDDQSLAALARLRPLNAYGWSKHLVDRRVIDDVVRGRPLPPQWCALKFFNVYGPNEAHKGDMQSLISKIHPMVGAGETVTLFRSHDPNYRDGEQLRDFVYVKDCVAVIGWLLCNPMVSGLFNVGTGVARSFLDLAHAVGAAIGCAANIRFIDIPERLRAQYQYFTRADIGKLRTAGYDVPFHSLEDGVRDFLGKARAPQPRP
jgi:ADP-L-glycero-D-manno-heptose 6-epimerase